MNNNTELSSWLKDLILKFREEYEKLSDEEKNQLSTFEDLNKPCQVESIWIRNIELDMNLQFHFFTKLEDEEDLKIKVEVLDYQNYIDFLDEYLENKKWDKLLSHSKLSTYSPDRKYSDEIKLILINGIKFFKEYTQSLHSGHKWPPSINQKSLIDSDAFSWTSIGKIQEIEAEKTIHDIISQTKQKAKEKLNEQLEEKPQIRAKKLIDGFGTFFYPPIWIGEFPKTSIRDIVSKKPLVMFTKIIKNTDYKDKILILESDGFLAIGETNRKKATKFLNEIMATALLLDIPASMIKESELGEISIDPEDRKVGRESMPINSMRTNLINSRWSIPLNMEYDRIKLSENKISNLFSTAEKFTNDESFKDLLSFYLESYSLFQNYSYSQSFIMSWLIIERYLSLLWKKNLIDNVKGEQKKRLKDRDRWSAYYIIETLTLLGIIKTNEKYKTLMRLKKKRDHIVHRGEQCSKEEAEECLNLAKLLVIENF